MIASHCNARGLFVVVFSRNDIRKVYYLGSADVSALRIPTCVANSDRAAASRPAP
jgi:hypothetical protein